MTDEKRTLFAVVTSREDRQRAVVKWAGETFGHASLTTSERAMRVIEEAVELVQAEGISKGRILAVVDHVYGKSPGDPAQEAGGLGVTLLAYCAVRGLSADQEEAREVERVLSIDPEYFRARHNAKAVAGIAVHAPGPEGKVLHLKTQRDQPYGSERMCCERCGISPLPPEPLSWTDDETFYNNPPEGFVNCGAAKKDQDGDHLPAP